MSKNKVMVVDDEPFILRSLSFVLRREGFEVVEARDGQEAIERLESEDLDMVFLDVMMPKKNGYEVLEEIRANPKLAGLKVIMLTAKGQASDREKGIALGVDQYLTKPFSPLKIVEQAREILERAAADSQPEEPVPGR